jgi:hypothetical protein
MATVRELSDAYSNFMLNPLAPGDEDVCEVCLTFTEGYDTCYACGHQQTYADAVLPISYSLHFGQLHNALAGFLERHEGCLAGTVGAEGFDVVVTVPSGEATRDRAHPLPTLVGEVVGPTKARYSRALARSTKVVGPRMVDPEKFEVQTRVDGQAVLLVDDTWTTGAGVQSAAGALKGAGAVTVGVVVVGRHLHEDFGNNRERLKMLATPFDWSPCALEI